jgi:hypothetical protein
LLSLLQCLLRHWPVYRRIVVRESCYFPTEPSYTELFNGRSQEVQQFTTEKEFAIIRAKERQTQGRGKEGRRHPQAQERPA